MFNYIVSFPPARSLLALVLSGDFSPVSRLEISKIVSTDKETQIDLLVSWIFLHASGIQIWNLCRVVFVIFNTEFVCKLVFVHLVKANEANQAQTAEME